MNFLDKPRIPFKDYVDQIVEWNSVAGSSATLEQQAKLVIEEAKELVQAYENEDPVEFLKEACDSIFTGAFYRHLSGYNPAMYDLYVVGPIGLFVKQIKRRLETVTVTDTQGIDALVHYGIAILASISADAKGAIQEVIDSNYSKFHKAAAINNSFTKDEAKRIEESSNGRYKGVKPITNNGYIIWKDSENKVMKWSGYIPADVSKFISIP